MYIINTIYISQQEIQQEEDYEKTVEEKLWEEAGMETKEWLKETVCEKPKEAIFEKASSEPPKFEKAHFGPKFEKRHRRQSKYENPAASQEEPRRLRSM